MDKLIDLNTYPISENLKALLKDKTTKKNIIFATSVYSSKGTPTDDQRQNNLQATGNVGITDKKVSPGKSRQDILQTVTMEELYDTVYPPKVPIVDGLLNGCRSIESN